MKNIFIVGAGVCGINSAIMLKKRFPDANITLIEKDNEIGKRIKVSGNGRCNFSNKNIDLDKYHGKKEILPIINLYKEKEKDYLKDINLHYYLDNEGRFYPVTDSSKTVISLLQDQLFNLKISVKTNENLNEIHYLDDNIELITDKNKYLCDDVILCIGGMASNYTIKNYKFLNQLNLKQNNFISSLCPIVIKEKLPASLNGKRNRCLISLFKNNELIYEENGEIIFKEDGISGICTFNVSSFLAEDINNINKYSIRLNFISGISKEEIETEIKKFKAFNTLKSYVNNELASYLFSLKGDIYSSLSNLRFTPVSLYPLSQSQVSKGGIDLSEINFNNLTLKKFPHIYLGGEMIDINGLCGGYNIFFATACAYYITSNFKL